MSLRIISVPAVAGAALDDLAWPAKEAGDTLPSGWDLSAVLTADPAAPLTLVGAKIAYTPDLTATDPQLILTAGIPTGIIIEQLGGGTPGQNSTVQTVLALADADGAPVTLTLRTAQPINVADTTVYATTPLLTGTPLTIGGAEITIGGQPLNTP